MKPSFCIMFSQRLHRATPQHPYTRKLLGAFPSLTGERGDFIRTGVADDRTENR